jgi:hypothetical protein
VLPDLVTVDRVRDQTSAMQHIRRTANRRADVIVVDQKDGAM